MTINAISSCLNYWFRFRFRSRPKTNKSFTVGLYPIAYPALMSTRFDMGRISREDRLMVKALRIENLKRTGVHAACRNNFQAKD